MTPTERLGQILNSLNITNMPHYWAAAIVRELATHGITLEVHPDDSGRNGENFVLPLRGMPTPGGLLCERQKQDSQRELMGERLGPAGSPTSKT